MREYAGVVGLGGPATWQKTGKQGGDHPEGEHFMYTEVDCRLSDQDRAANSALLLGQTPRDPWSPKDRIQPFVHQLRSSDEALDIARWR